MLIALEFAAVPAAALAAGSLYQALGSRRDRVRYAHGGRLVTIGNGSTLYLLEQGRGGPTVIFESGVGATNLNWRHVQESVASFTATVSYDRCGLGWSSACRTARTPTNIATELHEALQHAAIQPPYILVGHSFGGLAVRRFALLYPGDVAGLVLVDPMRCEEWPPLNPNKHIEIERGRKLIRCGICIAHCGLARLVLTSLFSRSGNLSRPASAQSPLTENKGVAHVIHRLRTEVGKMPAAVRPVVAAHWSRPAFYAGMRKHIDAIPDTVREMQSAQPVSNIPVVVLTPGTSVPLCETALSAIGNRVQQIIVPDSGHWVHLDEPQIVIDTICSLHAQAVAEMAPVSGCPASEN